MKRIEGLSKQQIIYMLELATGNECKNCPLRKSLTACRDGYHCESLIIECLLDDVTPEDIMRFNLDMGEDYIHDCFTVPDGIDKYSKVFSCRLAACTEDIKNISDSMGDKCPDPVNLCEWISDELKMEYEYLEYLKYEKKKH